MLIITAKVPRKKLAAAVAMAALAFCCAVGLNLEPPSIQPASATSLPETKGVRSNEERIVYLAAYGWTVTEQPLATQELLIPEEMDENYAEYLALQKAQGFDLTKYAGKRVKRYTYEITNYPTGETGVQANLLLHKNTVVGGEVLSPKMDGFLHGLAMP